jgi:glyoxylase-like metal-dependent hydrolase (beta-lactamase superfamily II)
MAFTRRQFMVTSSLAVVGGTVQHVPGFGQQPAAAPPPTVTKFEPIRSNVGIFTGRGGTIGWLITSDGLVVVDSQFPDTAKACAEGLKERSKRQMDVLINTHHHGDHTGGNAVLRPLTKRIVAHARVPELQKMVAAQQKTEAQQAYPDTTFADTWSVDLGSDKVSARHYGPGHTGGDIVVFFERANIVHMGDLMFNRRHPRIDRPAGASARNWMTLLEKVAADHGQGTTYIFGHAREDLSVQGTRADLLVFRDYLNAVLDYVQKGISAGRSKDEIAKLGKLPKFEDYAEAPPVLTLAGVLGTAYDELTAKS